VQEAQRVVGMRLPMQWLAQAGFDQALGAAYQHDSSAAMLMVEGLGNELDLASLAEQIQETEDLLEQEDDAPSSLFTVLLEGFFDKGQPKNFPA